MKGLLVSAAAAALSGVVEANHRHEHELFRRVKKGTEVETCIPECTTIYSTWYGEPTLYIPKPTHKPVVPTPVPEKCPTPGTYSWPATTLTLTETTTVCAATSTRLPKGEHTYGGVTTVVDAPTTVVCPYAKETTKDGVVTSVVEVTTYVCPSAGTYTIAPAVTTVTVDETVVIYPVVTNYKPGTYTKPAAVVTVTQTDYVTICPWIGGPSPAAPTPEPKPVDKPVEKPAEVPKPVEKPSGDHYGIAYVPYTDDSSGKCKSRETVFDDVKNIKRLGFNTLRFYSTDCDALKNIGDACKEHGVNMIIGIFIKESCEGPEVDLQLDQITSWAQWGLVKLIIAGNESVFGKKCDVHGLKSLLTKTRSRVKEAGYGGPITTTETVNVLQEIGTQICDLIDLGAANIHPYFNSGIKPSAAGDFVRSQLDIVKNICGKGAISTESGWPSQGSDNGVAHTGDQQRKEAIDSIRAACGSDVVFFQYGESHWKTQDSCDGCEKFFNALPAFDI